MKRFAPLLPYLLPLGLTWKAVAQESVTDEKPPELPHTWVANVGGFQFGFRETFWEKNDGWPDGLSYRSGVNTRLIYGFDSIEFEDTRAPVVAGCCAVFAGLMIMASGVLIRRRRNDLGHP
ncbi:MAG: hypothetical protein K8R23_05635 [Chthoniobacter sp.]|nr:hypothetical protein [Chthoniobacter sp.]